MFDRQNLGSPKPKRNVKNSQFGRGNCNSSTAPPIENRLNGDMHHMQHRRERLPYKRGGFWSLKKIMIRMSFLGVHRVRRGFA